jgi:SAM-dependent methyltransferase
MPGQEFLDYSYVEYEHIEEAFQTELDTSLNPRGLDYLLDMVNGLAFAPGSTAVDAGCGNGRYSLELARRFALSVHGIDPVPAHIELCNQKRAETAIADPATAQRLRFDLGEVENLPDGDATQDLVWFRDALVHVAAVDRAFGECYRVLRKGGYLLLYHQLATDRLEAREASWLLPVAHLPDDRQTQPTDLPAQKALGRRRNPCEGDFVCVDLYRTIEITVQFSQAPAMERSSNGRRQSDRET